MPESSFKKIYKVSGYKPGKATKPLKRLLISLEYLNHIGAKLGLSNHDKELIKLIDIDGYSISQVASIIGVSRQNVSKKRQNIIKKLPIN